MKTLVEGLDMTNETSKRPMSAGRAAAIQAAMRKIAASGLKQRFASENAESAFEAEKAMEGSDFARPRSDNVDPPRRTEPEHELARGSVFEGGFRITKVDDDHPYLGPVYFKPNLYIGRRREITEHGRSYPLLLGMPNRDKYRQLGPYLVTSRMGMLNEHLAIYGYGRHFQERLWVDAGQVHRPDEDKFAPKGPMYTGSLRLTGDRQYFLRIKMLGDAVLTVPASEEEDEKFLSYDQLQDQYRDIAAWGFHSDDDEGFLWPGMRIVDEESNKERD